MLHNWHIDEAQYRRHEERRGRRFAYESLDPMRTALVVVDLVPFFVDEMPSAPPIVPNVNRLVRALRSRGGTVVWIVPADDPRLNRVEFFGPEIADLYASSGGRGPMIDRISPTLEPAVGDLFLEKTSPSAFFEGGCDLHPQLGAIGIDTVIVVGAVANVCCESTVRDAFTLGYRTIMVADANAAYSEASLNATLTTVYRSFGDVRPTDEVVALIAEAASVQRPIGE